MRKRAYYEGDRNTAVWRRHDEAMRRQTKDDPFNRSRRARMQWTLVVMGLVGMVALLRWGSIEMVHLIDRIVRP
jgi:hypothetical protein